MSDKIGTEKTSETERRLLARVLIVDDDKTIRAVAQKALHDFGFSTVEAKNGQGGLDKFEHTLPDVVLMDVLMPEMDGFEACRRLQELPNGKNTPVIIMTALDDLESIHRAYEVGATDFISKPLNPIVLGHRVRYILRSSQILSRLRSSEARLADAQRIAQLGNWQWDLAEGYLRGSEEFWRLLSLDPETVTISYERFLQAVDPEDRQLVNDLMAQTLNQRTSLDVNLRIVLPDGTKRLVRQQAEILEEYDGKPRTVVGTIQDITELKKTEEKIHYLAYYDILTGLPNRLLFKDRLCQALKSAERHRLNMAVMFVDIDRFKRINDTLGHSAGDLLLKAVAERMEKALRKSDTVSRRVDAESNSMARLGGDEFTILLPNIAYAEQAAKVAKRVLDAVSEPFDLNGQQVFVTGSIGIGVYPTDGRDVETLLKNADTAMYHVKDQGRNNYQFFSNSMNAAAFEKLVLENELIKAVERNEFVSFYQPQVDIRTGQIIGAEALLRWQHPTMGLILPGKFLPVAQEVGILATIDEWMWGEVCAQLRMWTNAGVDSLRIAVNVSNQAFWKPKLKDRVGRLLRGLCLQPDCLEFELTESIMMEDVDAAIVILRQLKELGLELSIDDFGTGYSSLSHMRHFPVDKLKIDRSFLSELPSSEANASITKAIIAMAHNLNKTVLAEGVETEQQASFLKENGCYAAQGYYFSPPVTADEFLELLEKTPVAPSLPRNL